ncbi:hypothetical protein FACS1894188_10200 [Clostridia bacterium]|nr:hypothetical protein FACS1894188_10200 [Clostridia bacterium]
MTREELNEIKTRLNLDAEDTDRDGLINLLYGDARAFILSYTNRTQEQWSAVLSVILIQLTVIYFNRQGVEGMSSRKEGEISSSFSFGDRDLPPSLIETLNQYRLARVL